MTETSRLDIVTLDIRACFEFRASDFGFSHS